MAKFAAGLFFIFLVLKLTGYILWSWIWVTSPLWIWIGLTVILITVIEFTKSDKQRALEDWQRRRKRGY